MLLNLFSYEYSIYHMTTEKPHFNFVSSVAINLFILMYLFENV